MATFTAFYAHAQGLKKLTVSVARLFFTWSTDWRAVIAGFAVAWSRSSGPEVPEGHHEGV
ncbi:hypothetical protein [Amycolatopsis sp. H20-H5]|uniref:hypothetical protein n=1 Tax=Amycolatopsis sp. H20-H5 TaxID=3046309 RepID=UPI002DBFB94D|nr:hypothetical protein [Amycolatopsis sp. H20-H5]MEC3979114.1 hypothetical protein [Amycolatopsis sp. H20-H5]